MNNSLTRFNKDGIELLIDTVTGESFASQSAVARMANVSESAIRKWITSNQIQVKSTEIPTATGFKTSNLLDENAIYQALEKYNPSLLIHCAKAGLRVYIHKLAGYEINSTAIASQTESIVIANQQIALLSEQNELLKTQCEEFKATANLIVGQVVEITSKIEALKLRVEGCDRTIGNVQFQLTNQANDFKVLLSNNQYQQELTKNTFNLLDEIQNKIASQGDINQFIPEKSAEAYREKAEQIDQENRLKFKKIREINEIKKWEKN